MKETKRKKGLSRDNSLDFISVYTTKKRKFYFFEEENKPNFAHLRYIIGSYKERIRGRPDAEFLSSNGRD